ncbi:MAG TPA: four-helix bundle copper-binding protein [Methylophilus sp.]
MDCTDFCRLTASFIARGSDFTELVCQDCAEICTRCAEECDQHATSHCHACAQACRRCAEACLKVGSAAFV